MNNICKNMSEGWAETSSKFYVLCERSTLILQVFSTYWPAPGWCRPGTDCASCTGHRLTGRASTEPGPDWKNNPTKQDIQSVLQVTTPAAPQHRHWGRDSLFLDHVCVCAAVQSFTDDVTDVGAFPRTARETVDSWGRRGGGRAKDRKKREEKTTSK